MQQERNKGVAGGGGGPPEDVDPPDRRLKPTPSENQQQPQQPQKCPRCDSINTKFCYYNNYSLSQPRYFCKTCRRYWTQGGTLRNVPVGGGCRKTKRKPSGSGESSRSQLPSTQQQQQNLAAPPPNIMSTNSGLAVGPAVAITEAANLSQVPASASAPTLSPVNPYYPAGGFLSSLPAMQPLSQPQSFINQPINVGGDFGGSNLAILQGLNFPSLGSQQQQRQQPEFYQMGNRDRNLESLFASGEDLIQPVRSAGLENNWHQTFTNPTAADTNLWNIGSSSNRKSPSSSFNPYHWADLQGYGPPP